MVGIRGVIELKLELRLANLTGFEFLSSILDSFTTVIKLKS